MYFENNVFTILFQRVVEVSLIQNGTSQIIPFSVHLKVGKMVVIAFRNQCK